jgi:Zn-dependent protease with chaperone function
MTTTSMSETTYAVRRLTLAVPCVRVFQRAYEEAVPDLPLSEVQELLRRAAPWQEMVDLIDARAPNGFLIYFRNDLHAVMKAAGDEADCRPSSSGRLALALGVSEWRAARDAVDAVLAPVKIEVAT